MGDKIYFFYNGELLCACDTDFIECTEFYNLMESDSAVAQGVLDYLNSFGDPIYPVSDTNWMTAETDISNVDIWDLYCTFMQWIDYEYNDWGDIYIESIPGCEIFSEAASDMVTGSSKIKHPKYFANMVSASMSYDGDKYYVAGYYDNLMRGLGDDLSTDSFDAVLEFANELANDGYFIKIKNVETGSEVHYDANVWLDAIENGDVPEDVYEVTM